MPYTLEAVQALFGGEICGKRDVILEGVNSLEGANSTELVFADHERYLQNVIETKASAVVVPKSFPEVSGKTFLRVDQPRSVFVQVMGLFAQPYPAHLRGIHASAQISPHTELGEDVTIREYAVVRAARIGQKTIIESGVHIGSEVSIGEKCFIGPHVVIMDKVKIGNRVTIHGGAVIGGDGFGYVWDKNQHRKVPQVGTVVIEDDVEIGCNSCVDRAMFGSTLIKRGTKIDNFVQIAHNDIIGEDVIITGQVGIAGSVTVGNRVMFGAQSCAVDHISIGDDVRVGAASLVTKNISSKESVWGIPARPGQRVKRELASLSRLPDLLIEFRKLLQRLNP
ncbi:MAG: UDP-3-O-(3-hydroxymyristoyl)glucosamine N-acyltransferase [Deltaproteobacteria bacterium]|nr:UDP-3-O-(3-hydroxymyristoyl)glucosamine N-acyltransferase [Deltaproteobacteria bacterium]MBI3016428.1 UDP-3-O-(3-hydroxymyristoyl)glucosamine N-acyltransferase [Deltaproteobacteria bacterium]